MLEIYIVLQYYNYSSKQMQLYYLNVSRIFTEKNIMYEWVHFSINVISNIKLPFFV